MVVAGHVIAVCNQKGGVGKTTTTFQLARAAVISGRRVLVVDNDPQGNLTTVATAEPVGDDQTGLADALSRRAPEQMSDVLVAGVWPGMDVAPTSGAALGYVRDELVIAGAGREGRLKEAISTVQDNYDLIFIDCAPSLDQLTINGLAAADHALVVSHSKLFSANGLAQLLDTIDQVRRYYNPTLQTIGVLINQHEDRTISGQTWLDELTRAAQVRGLTILDPPIPKRVVISDATEAARGLDQWGSAEATSLAHLYATHLATIEQALA